MLYPRNLQLNLKSNKCIVILLLMILGQTPSIKCQNSFIPKNVVCYTNNISRAIVHNNNGQLDEAAAYFKKANQIIPIHYWDLMFVKNLLKKQFDKELFLICVQEEFIQECYSSTLNDTSLSKNLSQKDIRKINKKVPGYKIKYLEGTNMEFESELLQIISLDQFARTNNIAYLYNCDTCIVYRKRLMKYIDSAYSIPAIKLLSQQNNITYRSFGASYHSFVLMLRHIVNNHSEDTVSNQFWENYVNKLVANFIITPRYFANLSDYRFNYEIDENKVQKPLNVYGEFSYYKGKLEIDNPEKTDQRRIAIGLLPLWESMPKSNLPNNYIIWYEGKHIKP